MTNQAVFSQMGVISVLLTLKFDTHCLLESHTPKCTKHTHAYVQHILNKQETTCRSKWLRGVILKTETCILSHAHKLTSKLHTFRTQENYLIITVPSNGDPNY